MLPRLVPERKFDAVTHANLVVDSAQVIADNVCADAELASNFVVFQPQRDELNDSLLLAA